MLPWCHCTHTAFSQFPIGLLAFFLMISESSSYIVEHHTLSETWIKIISPLHSFDLVEDLKMFHLTKFNTYLCVLDHESYLEKPFPLKDYYKIPPLLWLDF